MLQEEADVENGHKPTVFGECQFYYFWIKIKWEKTENMK